MLKEYLNGLKSKGNFSWNDLANMSGLPDATIRKIFSGETADPRFETVVKLVTAMGGSMDDIISEKKEIEIEMNAIIALKEVYENRIDDLKAISAEHLRSLKNDKKFLAIVACGLGLFLLTFLAIDILIGSVGWIRY